MIRSMQQMVQSFEVNKMRRNAELSVEIVKLKARAETLYDTAIQQLPHSEGLSAILFQMRNSALVKAHIYAEARLA